MIKIASVLVACAFSTAAFAQAAPPASGDRPKPTARDETKFNGPTVDTVPMAKSSPDNAARVKKTPGKKNAKKQAAEKPDQ